MLHPSHAGTPTPTLEETEKKKPNYTNCRCPLFSYHLRPELGPLLPERTPPYVMLA